MCDHIYVLLSATETSAYRSGLYQVNKCKYERAKTITRKNMTKTFCNENEQLYLETDALGVGLGASLLQTVDDMQFPRSKTPNNAVL